MLLELIIDPTCSIVLERQPAESNIMERKPRNSNEKVLTLEVLTKSILQGLAIFAASFVTYYILLKQNQENAQLARTMGLSIIMISNLFLVQVNSSNYEYAFRTMKYLIKDKVMWIANFGTIIGLLLILYTPLNKVLNLTPLTLVQFFKAVGIAAISVLWYELVKVARCV